VWKLHRPAIVLMQTPAASITLRNVCAVDP
jgi:hypothetical protein